MTKTEEDIAKGFKTDWEDGGTKQKVDGVKRIKSIEDFKKISSTESIKELAEYEDDIKLLIITGLDTPRGSKQTTCE